MACSAIVLRLALREGAPNFARAYFTPFLRVADFSGGLQRPYNFPVRSLGRAHIAHLFYPSQHSPRLVYVSLFLHLAFSSLPRRVRSFTEFASRGLQRPQTTICCRPPGAFMGFYRHFDISRYVR